MHFQVLSPSMVMKRKNGCSLKQNDKIKHGINKSNIYTTKCYLIFHEPFYS